MHKVEVYFEFEDGTASVVLNNIYNTSNTALVTQQLLNPYMNNDCGIGCISDIHTPDGIPTCTGSTKIDGDLVVLLLVGGISGDSTVGMINGLFTLINIHDTVTEV